VFGSVAECVGTTPICNLGYHVQQLHTIMADLQVPERFPGAPADEAPNAFIGIVDSDALLVAPPHELAFFDEQGRPRVQPRVGLPFGRLWEAAAKATAFVLGVHEPFRGMSYFPVMVHRAHFGAFRAHVEARHGQRIWTVWQTMHSMGMYSQFNLLITYLWHFQRASYAWHLILPDSDAGKPFDLLPLRLHAPEHEGFERDFSFLDDASLQVYFPRIFQHWRHHRWKQWPDEHMTRGYCRAVEGRHALCSEVMPDYAAEPFHGEWEPDLWDWEHSARAGPQAVAAQAAYFEALTREVRSNCCWNANAIGDWLLHLRNNGRTDAGRPDAR
jgi:hypothetical protein